MNMKDMTVTQLSDLTASSSAAPGGASISAMAAAYAASLACMVAKPTRGKTGYEAVQDRMAAIGKQAV